MITLTGYAFNEPMAIKADDVFLVKGVNEGNELVTKVTYRDTKESTAFIKVKETFGEVVRKIKEAGK